MVSQAYRENLDASVFSRVMQRVLKSYQTIPLSFALFFSCIMSWLVQKYYLPEKQVPVFLLKTRRTEDKCSKREQTLYKVKKISFAVTF